VKQITKWRKPKSHGLTARIQPASQYATWDKQKVRKPRLASDGKPEARQSELGFGVDLLQIAEAGVISKIHRLAQSHETN
jgi:hypothetical protein